MAGAVEKRPWPPVHDEEALKAAIKRLARGLPKTFYLTSFEDLEPCQGDVLALGADMPVIDADGDAAASGATQHWLVVANTCDVSRAFEENGDVEYVPIAPLIPASNFSEEVVQGTRDYMLSRLFYIPPWDAQADAHIADFMRLVPIHRDALRGLAKIGARMCFDSWALLNACLVRLLCRADQRDV